MKSTLIGLVILLIGMVAHAGERAMTCSPGVFTQSFGATLKDSEFTPGSGFFSVINASINVEYASAQLTCVGNTLKNISCIGFWFGLGNQIVNVTTVQKSDGLYIVAKNLTPSNVADGLTWKCSLQ